MPSIIIIIFNMLAIIFGQIDSGLPWFFRSTAVLMQLASVQTLMWPWYGLKLPVSHVR